MSDNSQRVSWCRYGLISFLAELLIGAIFIRWLGSFAEDAKGHTSVKRFAMLLSITVAGIGTLWMVFCRGIWLMNHESSGVYFELAVLMITASGASVGAYIWGKPSDRNLPKPKVQDNV